MTDLKLIFTMLMIALFSCACVQCKASDPIAESYGITLAPNETLVAVDGVPVRARVLQPVRTVAATAVDVAVIPVQVARQATSAVVQRTKARVETMRCRVDAFGKKSCSK